MQHYSLESAVLASLRAVDSENSPYCLKAILVFHSSASRTTRCRQLLLFFPSWTSQRRQNAHKERGKSCDLDPTSHRELSHFSFAHISGMLANTPPKFRSTLDLHSGANNKRESSLELLQTALWAKALFIST